METYDPASLHQLLPLYYKRCFPFKHYVGWLGYGRRAGEYLARRELAFILKDDVYLRYQSFASQAQLEAAVQRLVPEKIDIGPVFSHPPSEKKRLSAEDFVAQERELVFDVDLTDYDDTRRCCQGGAVCGKCWRFMVVAVRVLDRALREDLGFRHLLWVFSGRRGVHCWVADRPARQLANDGRSAVAEYLQLISGGDKQRKKVSLSKKRALHPAVRKAAELVEAEAEALAEEQGWLADEASVKWLLELVPDEELRLSLETALLALEAGLRWRALRLRLREPKDLPASCRFLWQEILIQLAYPRLDINVSKGTNHLLKSPFVVHPKTGKVAVPFRPENVHLFDQSKVPTISLLHRQLMQLSEAEAREEAEAKGGGEAKGGAKPKRPLDYRRTDLADYVAIFQDFVDAILKDAAKEPKDPKQLNDSTSKENVPAHSTKSMEF